MVQGIRYRRGMTTARVLRMFVIIVMIGTALVLLLALEVQERGVSRRTLCASNLRQIGQACIRYSIDFGDRFPTVAVGGAPSRPMKSLALLFDRYLPKRDLFRCPDTSDQCFDLAPGDTFAPHGQPQTGPHAKRRECSYGYDDLKGPTTDPDVAIAADALPAPGEKTTSVSIATAGAGRKTGMNSANHGGKGQNVLYYDGHTKWSCTCFCGVDDDNIYEAADPANVAPTDSYIHQ